LKRVAAALRTCCLRTADITARYGGEEFAIILLETELSEALQIANAANDAVAQLEIEHEKSVTGSYVTISAGISQLSRTGDSSAQQLIMDPNQRVFQAKRLGRNRIVAADAECG
jgi:diguanylate cyclase (GGDEF)-like protein